ncbi:translation initiation factor IF-1 [Pedosphaera parvula]|uniref:Translation initiation factor IF-1 n=1 Tax=Pedosphaera parvula (strain Ellin514) TaxID=320771 RepID=B9XFL0_PEDPL|nr:translation initiation factor IF-1 [Pedosphaera parvula]EEF61374.1 translation initiation factor IF-1 [Pedosphaera parvula Ellin514]
MAREDAIKAEGSVVEALPNTVYRVELANGHQVMAHFKRRAMAREIRLVPGDKVILEMTPFDLSTGCIIWNQEKV